MPDDSSEDYKAAQGRHADKVKTRRAMEEMGVAPVIIRQKLASFEQREKQRTKPASEIEGLKPWTPSNERPPVDQQIAPRPFQADAQSKKGGVLGDVDNTDKQIIIVDNGTANYYTIKATFVSAV